MSDFSRPFSAKSHPARAHLLQKGVYLLLAFDVWLTMVPHGARYGVGGFNVTHFAWLDPWLPIPSAAFYVGSMSLIGSLALLHVLTSGARFLRIAVTCLYTASWVVSLFDSYQHHYLLSWILLWTVFMPNVASESAAPREVEHVRGFGLPMTAITCAIVYSFTAIAKSEADWRAGHVLVRLSKSKVSGHPVPGVLDPLRDGIMSTLSVSEATAWMLIAHSVIALQVVTALGYFAATERDARPSRLRSLACALALCGAVSFHAFAEIGGMFDIGWFSYYMLWLAFVLLSPSAWVAALARFGAWPSRKLISLVSDPGHGLARASVLSQLVVTAAAFCLLGQVVDLPGAWLASALVAALLLVWGAFQLSANWTTSAQWLAISGVLTAAAFFLAMTQSAVRFDYYRRGAGELRALGEWSQALSMYRKADRYAPPGKSRKKQIEELERMIRAAAGDSD